MSSEAALYLPQALVKAASSAEVQTNAVSHHSPNEISDDALLIEAGEGSKDALGLLFRRHGRAVFNVACRILRDDSEAADLRQEVFLYLFQRAKLFDPQKGTALSWILQVTYHRAIDRRRYLNCRHHYDVQELNEQQLGTTSGGPSTDELDGRCILDNLREQLSDDQKRTLELHFFEGYSFREIAEKNGQTVGNIRHHYYRAIERLRSHVFSPKNRVG
jgi:RNA polymerase sigma-70 factor (ECF subfamily)